MPNALYYGDNLPILRRHIASESVDLIYLDPPFNSSRSYNVLFKEATGREADAQIAAFDDTWTWGPDDVQVLQELHQYAPHGVVKMLHALVDALGHNAVTAYLVMMTARLVELHRVLKPTGSLYLHCDPVASHYLKVILDAVFDPRNFVNEITWQRTNAKGLAFTRFASNHDVLLFYAKSEYRTLNPQYTAHDPRYVENFYRFVEPESGRRYRLADLTNPNKDRPNLTYEFLGVTRVWRWTRKRMQEAYEQGLVVQNRPGGVPALKRYLDEQEGNPVGDTWTDIRPVQAQAAERLGYPTQKPLALLERIIQASSNPGDVVLDPFCGCGTAVVAAQKLGRAWIGIDITHLAISLIKYRLKDTFGDIPYDVIGEPVDLSGARDLAAQDRYQFQWWALSLVKARPYQDKKKGADTGIDGLIYFQDSPPVHGGTQGGPKTITVQVKSGHVSVATVRELAHVVARERAAIGLLITLEPSTRIMQAEAVAVGNYLSPVGASYPKIQILTIEQLLSGEQPRYPYGSNVTFKSAEPHRPDSQKPLW